MCRSKVLAVLDMPLICATFLKVEFGRDTQLRVKDPFKHLTWNVLTKLWFNLLLFLQKIIHPMIGSGYASNLFSLRIPLIFFQTITLQTQGISNVSSTLFQRCDVEQH